jgi:hypothetical protein
VYERYADITVPANGFAMKMTPLPNSEIVVQFLMSDVWLGNVSQRLWRRILADGNRHVGIQRAVGATGGWIYGDSSPQGFYRPRPADHLDVLYQ